MTTIKVISDIQAEIEKLRIELEEFESGNVKFEVSNVVCSEEEQKQIFGLLVSNRETRIQELLAKLESIQVGE